ncbi:sensor histidine kinase [Gluconacetobacter diazotrophicus]|uniref:histidine kinase n=2 Tax=Gluconacetobacter diazotrophicus TaxID=33996 RepID=A0A7W4I3M9_GLUDI|nr:sensor histidine kinase [Gluconacetobacter diazotrophicus]
MFHHMKQEVAVEREESARPMRGWLWCATTLIAVLVFGITLFPSHDAFGVLYVLVIVLAADRATMRMLQMIGAACVVLECAAFSIVHHGGSFDGAYARLALSITATIVVTILTIRNKRARDDLARHARALTHADRIATLGHLALSIAHEVNQPLSAMTTLAFSGGRWLDRTRPDLDEALSCFRQIEANGRRAADIVGHVRELTRKAPVARCPLDLRRIVEDTIALLQSETTARRVVVQKIFQNDLPMIHADRIEIQQVVVNLMMNAVQALEPVAGRRRTITVSLRADRSRPGAIEMEIRDTGPGFSQPDPNALFEPFVTTRPDGMGMGLAICRNIVRSHGGAITAANGTPSGAVITVRLPAAHAMAAAAA